ncbi:hypothetical protein GGI24_002921, partial [Coemansia furcata]
MDDLLRTPKSESRRVDDDLSLQSPPMLAQTPHVRQLGSSPEDERPSAFAKRSIADIATPRKPGSAEARVQEESAYINSPARAPPSTKRQMRSESPLGFRISLGHEEQPPEMLGEVASDHDDSFLAQSCGSLLFSPPRFVLVTESSADNQESRVAESGGDDDMLAEYADESTTLLDAVVSDADVDVDVDVGELETEAMEAEDAVTCVLIACESTDDAAVDAAIGTGEGVPDAETDSDIEFTTAHTRTEVDSDTELCFSDTHAESNQES